MAKRWSLKPSRLTNLTVLITALSPGFVLSLCTWLQARAAAEAMRATLSQVEAALEAREAELHDSWHALRLQAADLQSDSELTPKMLQPDASARVRAQLMT
jgi:cell division protein FtsB